MRDFANQGDPPWNLRMEGPPPNTSVKETYGQGYDSSTPTHWSASGSKLQPAKGCIGGHATSACLREKCLRLLYLGWCGFTMPLL
ncbi:Neuronal PAS domain-containing protein 3 [Chelonia mydas]|uniref:Neuronal PAS domain-containing protein 3 n=1 Tax=Chelonia mydas TaxID=8469 RepID=M7BRJ7_CHEMY|nr:Neuronal PAS domain-containing protein 3 [Chelonia mydas]